MDTRALNHILTHSAEYQKPEGARNNLAQILGKGVLFTEGTVAYTGSALIAND